MVINIKTKLIKYKDAKKIVNRILMEDRELFDLLAKNGDKK